jgi:hypothetical protein
MYRNDPMRKGVAGLVMLGRGLGQAWIPKRHETGHTAATAHLPFHAYEGRIKRVTAQFQAQKRTATV